MTPEFRVWDKADKVYDFPTQIDIDDSGHISVVDTYHGSLVDGDFVLEQYTGLKDFNGKDIYEGDIIKVVFQYWGTLGNRYEVKFKQGAFYVKHELLSEISPSTLVVGNIHENPELLEVEDEG